MDEYNVEEYFNPTVKRNTYDKSDDHYISEQDEVSEAESKSEVGSDEEEVVDDSEYKKGNEPEESVPEVVKNERKEPKKKPQVKPQSKISTEQQEEPPRTTCRLILHVSNLSEETTKSMIEDFFGDAGSIKSVRIPKRRGTNNFAFVEMRDMEGYKVNFKQFYRIILILDFHFRTV